MRFRPAAERVLRVLLGASLLAGVGCAGSLEDQAADARRLADYTVAADLYTRAALETTCPDRGRLLIARAEVQELALAPSDAMNSLDSAIRSCPDYSEGYWARAQRAAAAGNRGQALDDAGRIRGTHPDAAALYSELSMAAEADRSLRSRAHSRILGLREALDLEAPERRLKDRAATQLVRRIPVPVTLKYSVQQEVSSPSVFSLEWEETLSYRGDPAASDYLLVRSLQVAPLPNDLPVYFRLQMANQRLPMRFAVDQQGKITEAGWLRNGPERGIRPSVLAPELEAMLKRRRVFDPGGAGQRGPGDRWRGEDVRIVDAQPVQVTYDSEAIAWVELYGIRALHIRSVLKGEGYEGSEEAWLHPSTAVPIRWTRDVSYWVESRSVQDAWNERIRGTLISISGVN